MRQNLDSSSNNLLHELMHSNWPQGYTAKYTAHFSKYTYTAFTFTCSTWIGTCGAAEVRCLKILCILFISVRMNEGPDRM